MRVNQRVITAIAWSFVFFLSGFLLKHVLYDDGFSFANILLIIVTVPLRIHFTITPCDYRIQDLTLIILHVLFDKDLVDIQNVLLLVGIACVREQFKNDDNMDKILKEIATFVCGLTCLFIGWYNVGKMIVIQCLVLFYMVSVGSVLGVVLFSVIVGAFKTAWKKARSASVTKEKEKSINN